MSIAKANNININYKVAGYGEPLVMIMGVSSDQSSWKHQINFFKKHYRVITFDNRGSGNSEKPKGTYSTKMMADDTIQLLDYLGIDQAHIMGISMGGMIAQEIAINSPQRVMKVVLANTYACNDKKSNGSTLEMYKAVRYSPRNTGTALTTMAFNRPLYRLIAILQARIRSRFTGASVKAEIKVGFIGQIGACTYHNALERLPLIKAPTLVISGTQDKVVKPSSSEVLAMMIPNARLVKIENGSHVMNIEMRKVFNQEVLRFLKND
jgi:3-oxoadipate enol-lactonase